MKKIYPDNERPQHFIDDRAVNAPEVDHHDQAPEVYRWPQQPDSDGLPTPILRTIGDHDDPSAPRGDRSPTSNEKQVFAPTGQQHARRYCGLRKRTAVVVASIVFLISISAIIGGVVGGLKSHSTSDDSQSTIISGAALTSSGLVSTKPSSSTKTTTAKSTTTIVKSALPTSSDGILPLNCNAINNTQYTVKSQTFYIYCMVDLSTGSTNLAASLQPSIDKCIDYCAEYNMDNVGLPCQGLTFGANLTKYKSVNCFLKRANITKSPYNLDKTQAAAVLIA